MSTVRESIMEKFKQARRDRDEPTKNVIGMLRTKVQSVVKSGTGREEDDTLWMEVLTGYAKQLGKTIAELDKAGERGAEAKVEAEFELQFCQQFLPTKLDEPATRVLVQKLIDEGGITSSAQMGKLMGMIMKSHRDEVDGAIARQVATELLS